MPTWWHGHRNTKSRIRIKHFWLFRRRQKCQADDHHQRYRNQHHIDPKRSRQRILHHFLLHFHQLSLLLFLLSLISCTTFSHNRLLLNHTSNPFDQKDGCEQYVHTQNRNHKNHKRICVILFCHDSSSVSRYDESRWRNSGGIVESKQSVVNRWNTESIQLDGNGMEREWVIIWQSFIKKIQITLNQQTYENNSDSENRESPDG